MTKKKNMPKIEYFFLTDKLEELNAALDGYCNNIDCDKYIYKYCLKKKYAPVLKHKVSCIPYLTREKEAFMRILSLPRYKKYRYEKCSVCGKILDTLGNDFACVSFTRPSRLSSDAYEVNVIDVHKKCKSKVPTPEGWKKR